MNTPLPPTVWLCLASDAARQALRAVCMAMRQPPADLVAGPDALARLDAALVAQPHSVALIDMAAIAPAAPSLITLAAALPDPQRRARVALTRALAGLWPTAQAWALELGFAGLWADLDPVSLAQPGQPLVECLARLAGAPPLPPEALAQYFSAMQVKLDDATPRHRIRRATGLTAEALCQAMASHVKAIDRMYHFKTYPSCHTGTEAVDWLGNRFQLKRPAAVRLGLDLQALGLLQHVVHEQPFADLPNFYRPTLASAVDRWNLGAVYALVSQPSGLDVKDRTYLGTTYARCFVGAEAVQWLSKRLKLRSHEAEILLNRLLRFGLIEHVTGEHPVRDGHFFYRFTVPQPAMASRAGYAPMGGVRLAGRLQENT
ncbi:MAG: hypothetical protein AB7P37_11150 [Ramlibacter sp.]